MAFSTLLERKCQMKKQNSVQVSKDLRCLQDALLSQCSEVCWSASPVGAHLTLYHIAIKWEGELKTAVPLTILHYNIIRGTCHISYKVAKHTIMHLL